MLKFSANLGFLWTELTLPDAICAARSAGFDAVECHWPYDEDPNDIRKALDETGLRMLGLNTRRGNPDNGDNGLAALPSRKEEARSAIDQAIDYARAIDAQNIHVMAGNAKGDEAHQTFIENLTYACEKTAGAKINILIEPLNSYDAPDYFLRNTDQAKSIIKEVATDNLKLMFDCYHVQLMEGDLSNRFKALKPIIGHVQFAGVPDRGSPDTGEVNYLNLFRTISQSGYNLPLGAEYKPNGPTENTLQWLHWRRQTAEKL